MQRRAITAHAGWVHDFLRPGPGDVYANHAQFNFGMSLFDLFSSLTAGATLVLVPDEIRALAPRVATRVDFLIALFLNQLRRGV